MTKLKALVCIKTMMAQNTKDNGTWTNSMDTEEKLGAMAAPMKATLSTAKRTEKEISVGQMEVNLKEIFVIMILKERVGIYGQMGDRI